ncbi:unnamed protein product [Acidocella sp. C78]|nr:unnamed protein product [Acidocella sp. C78]
MLGVWIAPVTAQVMMTLRGVPRDSLIPSFPPGALSDPSGSDIGLNVIDN